MSQYMSEYDVVVVQDDELFKHFLDDVMYEAVDHCRRAKQPTMHSTVLKVAKGSAEDQFPLAPSLDPDYMHCTN